MMTPELHGIIRYLAHAGVQFRITDVDTPGVHSSTSYHYQGLALDLSGQSKPYVASELLAVFAAFGPVENRLAELFYSGAPYAIKDGRRIVLPASLVASHWNHVHVAVPRGIVLREEFPMPAIPEDKKIVAAFSHGDGYVIVFADGAVFCFGCDFKGRPTWDGNQWVV